MPENTTYNKKYCDTILAADQMKKSGTKESKIWKPDMKISKIHLIKTYFYTATISKTLFQKAKSYVQYVLKINFDYKKNLAVLHCDESVMPKNKKVWSSWNTYVDPKNLNKSSLTYWLNLLQNINCEKNIFLTLNPLKEIPNERIYKKIEFTHPYYDQKALDNQKNLKNIQNKENLLFCGSYFGYGFHEDGIKSSIEMLKNLNE